MNQKKTFEELVRWGVKDEKNRHQAIALATKVIAILNQTSNKHLSAEELNELIGGSMGMGNATDSNCG